MRLASHLFGAEPWVEIRPFVKSAFLLAGHRVRVGTKGGCLSEHPQLEHVHMYCVGSSTQHKAFWWNVHTLMFVHGFCAQKSASKQTPGPCLLTMSSGMKPISVGRVDMGKVQNNFGIPISFRGAGFSA